MGVDQHSWPPRTMGNFPHSEGNAVFCRGFPRPFDHPPSYFLFAIPNHPKPVLTRLMVIPSPSITVLLLFVAGCRATLILLFCEPLLFSSGFCGNWNGPNRVRSLPYQKRADCP